MVSEKSVSLAIPFKSSETALMVYDVLSVDKEFKGSKVKKDISVEHNNISVQFYGSDYKILRVAVNGFLKNIVLIVKSMKQFGP